MPAARTNIRVADCGIRLDDDGIGYATGLVTRVCQLAGCSAFIDDARASLEAEGVVAAVCDHNTPALFNWLVSVLSYQGISDQVAAGYMELHGNATWQAISRDINARPSCPKLASYWHFQNCRYSKKHYACSEPNHLPRCPLPAHWLRNGRLNQTAYSLYLFIRDVADSDLVAWIDGRLDAAARPSGPDRLARMRAALIEPLKEVYGVSDKVLMMTLSQLLIGASGDRRRWFEVGGSMIAVDTLVHNFLHRTGILHRLHADHPYGPACYREGGCAAVIEAIAHEIDARRFNRAFPKVFPRFVQHAIWRYCSQQGLDICNGNQIGDRARCENKECELYSNCDRISLVFGK
jgi:hypothetical protein